MAEVVAGIPLIMPSLNCLYSTKKSSRITALKKTSQIAKDQEPLL